jgi:hypothetical protein
VFRTRAAVSALRRALFAAFLGFALLSLAAGCARTPTGVGPPLPLVHPPWLSAVPATHDALSTVLAAMSAFNPQRGWSGARNQVFAGYLSALAHSGPVTTPDLFPTESDALAYALDAHVAWVIALGESPALRARDAWALREVPFPLDGRTSTLARLEDAVAALTPFEPRAALFLNPGWRGAPALPSAAIEARSLEYQLATQAGVCGRAPGFWALDRRRKVVTVSAFTRFMWGLPAVQPERTRRLLQLVPPPPDLAQAIVSTCGDSLLRCTIAGAAFDTSRLIEPPPRR